MLDYKGHQFNTPNDYFTHLLEENGMPNILGDFIEETIQVGGVSVHLRVLRKNEDAPTAVFIPGTATYAMCYAEFLHALYTAGMNVVGLDPRGHGQSKGLRGHYTIQSIMEDAEQAIQYAKQNFFGPVHLIGSSQGGITALYLATKGVSVDSVICQNIADLTAKEANQLSRFPWLGRLGKPMLKLFARLLPKIRIPIHAYLALYKVRVKHFGNARCFMQEDPLALEHITLGTLASLASTKLPNPLAALTLPVFVFQGDADEIFPVAYTQLLVDAIGSPIKEFKVYSKRGHGIMVNEPGEVAHDVINWIKGLKD
ncbi:MAG: alpha/beta fold hydrolase [Bacteroidetes bacterium]|nr:MAG: alpha/beta fold hydrolase [Bacteroidota bacterium]